MDDKLSEEAAGKFRFLVGSLVLIGVGLSVMSRMVLNVGIVSMIDEVHEQQMEANHLNWTLEEKNYLFAVFPASYACAMMMSGLIFNKFGASYPMLGTVLGSFLVNAVTPVVARYSYALLLASRILLGAFQGCMVPAAYELFSKWLTIDEANIFVALLKVGFALGSLFGSALPGFTSFLGFRWPIMFYGSSFPCAIWSILWFILATSKPQNNRWIKQSELQILTENQNGRIVEESEQTPWRKIVSSPSVLALAVTKFSYNLGMDFICSELSIYLSSIYKLDAKMISLIGSAGWLLEALLVTPIACLAHYLIKREMFALKKSNWRKIFQACANFGMAFAYFTIYFTHKPNLSLLLLLLLLIHFFYLFGVGGESLIPYDLSSKYPATIMAFAHSLSFFSSVLLPPCCSFILANSDSNAAKWNLVFLSIGSASTVGGLIFILIVKVKPISL